MKPTNVWRVMTPIVGAFGNHRWRQPLIVAHYEKDAIRIAEQDALELGYSFTGDIQVSHVAKATTEDG